MSEIIEHADRGNGERRDVRVGESTAHVSIKLYQDVYHQITGRTEQIRKRYSDNLLIEFSELEQLNHKLMQLCDVHDVVARNEVISVFHEKERKDQFTSFERFRAYNANAASPSVNVVMKYNFSIIPAGLSRPQEYVVTVRLTSRVALAKQMERDAPPFMRGRILSYLSNNTAEVTVEYADYVIARGFLEAFDEWVKGCKSTPKKEWLFVARRWSQHLPDVLRLGAALLVGWFALSAVPSYFQAGFPVDLAARFFIIYSTAAFVFIVIAESMGSIIEDAIDGYPVLSYLKLNRGDENLIQEFQERKLKVVLQFIVGSAITVGLGILSSKLEKLI